MPEFQQQQQHHIVSPIELQIANFISNGWF